MSGTSEKLVVVVRKIASSVKVIVDIMHIHLYGSL